jgi:hypothetical protein
MRILSALAAAAITAAIAQPAFAQSAVPSAAETPATSNADVVGMWVTENGFIRLELLPNGRYDEARGDRKSAYKGRYTVQGSALHFVDDSGFTATGTVAGGVLSVGGDSFRKE